VNFYIGDYEIRTDTHELLHKNAPQKVEPLVFRLLSYMLKHSERVLSRDELMGEIWRSRVVSDSALSATICAARHALGDTGRKQQCIKTISGCGYRFVAAFTRAEKEQQNHCHTTPFLMAQQSMTDRVLPDKPSIAVMNFVDLSASDKGSLLAYGLTTEVNSGLAHLPHFFVIARESAAVFANQGLSSQAIGYHLGVRYLVYANTEYLVKRVQITLSIIDTVCNAEIWSEHFERQCEAIPQVRDEIMTAIVIAVDAAIEQAEIERAFLIPTENLSAWENYHRGVWHSHRSTINDIDTGQRFFQRAVLLDPRFSRAYAGLADTYTSLSVLTATTMTAENEGEINKSFDYAQRSLACCHREAMGYRVLARALFFAQKYEQSLQTLEQGIQANPNYAHCHQLKGICSAMLGLDEQARQCLETAERLSSLDPWLFSSQTARAVSLVHQHKYADAAELSLLATYSSNAYFSTYAIASACLQLAGDAVKAQQYAVKALKCKPNYSTELYQRLTPHVDIKTRYLFISAMQRAGIPEVSVIC